MGQDLVAVDATCCRIIGNDPDKVEYLQMASGKLGLTAEVDIDQRGEALKGLRTDFKLIRQFEQLRLA